MDDPPERGDHPDERSTGRTLPARPFSYPQTYLRASHRTQGDPRNRIVGLIDPVKLATED